MNEKKKVIADLCVGIVLVFGLAVWCWLKPPVYFSTSERRPLKQFPVLTVDRVFGSKTGDSFMDEFEKYAADQFPIREWFRTVQSASALFGLGKKETNKLYLADGHISKLDHVLHMDSVNWSLSRFEFLRKKYLENSKVYLAIIPDKNFFLTEDAGYPNFDYEEFIGYFKEGTKDYAQFLDLKPFLTKDHYYSTDTHWKQEELQDVAGQITGMMGSHTEASLQDHLLTDDFRGVYYGQAALPVKPDELHYLTGDYIDRLQVNLFDSGVAEEIQVYDVEKGEGYDPYEYFLSGSKALITLENPTVETKKELVVFRDSFGSSIAPLLAGGYSKVTLVDIRYMSPAVVGRFVDFDGADVLFLYSTQVLNNSVGQFLK